MVDFQRQKEKRIQGEERFLARPVCIYHRTF